MAGMFFKYVVVHNEIGVRIFGSIHGAVFVAYLVATLVAAKRFGWGAGTILLGLAASVPPFCTALFEVWADRRGKLGGMRSRR